VPGEPTRDRSPDAAVDQMLRASMRGAHAPADACVDAETLAAWTDGTLPSGQASAVEMHLSNCSRCQAMMAVFARTEPPASVHVPFWKRWSLNWLVPLTVATAALVISIAMPNRETPQAPVQTSAKAEQAPSAVAAPVPGKIAEIVRPSVEQQPRSKQAPPTRSAAAAAPTVAPSPEPAAFADRPASVQPPPQQPPPAAQRLSAMADSSRAVGGVAGAAAASAETRVAMIEFSSPDPALSDAAVGGVGGAAGAGGGGGAARAGTSVAGGRGGGGGRGVVRPPTRWRVRNDTLVERSIDSGVTWEAIAIEPPAIIAAGAAPTLNSCWLVGSGGVVLRSTDGQHFDRVKFPEAVGLKAITATSVRDATVTAVDGRVFVTTDAGATWRLQGFPAASF